MQIAEQIRSRRTEMGLSQDGLAEAIYVSRQTISNWETGKTYPDLESLLRMSELFGVTADELLRGDAAVLERVMAEDARRMEWLTWGACIASVFAVAAFVGLSAAWVEPSGIGGLTRGTIAGVAVFVPLYAVGMGCAVAIERIKLRHDLVTYREIVAFAQGRSLEEVRRERGLRRHPALGAVAKFTVSAAAGAFVGLAFWRLFG